MQQSNEISEKPVDYKRSQLPIAVLVERVVHGIIELRQFHLGFLQAPFRFPGARNHFPDSRCRLSSSAGADCGVIVCCLSPAIIGVPSTGLGQNASSSGYLGLQLTGQDSELVISGFHLVEILNQWRIQGLPFVADIIANGMLMVQKLETFVTEEIILNK